MKSKGLLTDRSCEKSTKAFILVEVLVDIALVTLIATAVIATYAVSFKALNLAKAKIAAVALANEKMEILRNMPYNDLATQNGPIYPPGLILDDEIVDRKGKEFNVHTVIKCIDDSYDGLAGSVTTPDLNPCDYKKMEVTVSLVGGNNYLARLTSNVAAKAAETDTDTGIIRLCVINEDGNALAESTVTIQNTDVDPPVNITAQTGIDGCIFVPGLPEDRHNNYHLEVTKLGYSTDMTYPRTSQNPNALQPDVDVISQQVTFQTLVIDRLSTMVIQVVDDSGNPVPNVSLRVVGAKQKWFNPTVYKYDQVHTTDGSGRLELQNMEFDDYTISFVTSDLYMTSVSPQQPVHLAPDTTLNVLISSSTSATAPRIYSVAPTTGVVGTIAYLTIIGDSFAGPPTAKIIHSGSGAEIPGQNLQITQSDERIEVQFDLTGAPTGLWSLIITNNNGDYVKQSNVFEVLSP